MTTRTAALRHAVGPRYWWYRLKGTAYDPPLFSFLSDDEWAVLSDWYRETDQKYPGGGGEAAVPALSLLQGIIMGNAISRVVQCGHFAGFSTLLIGFMLRKMGVVHGLFSIDIDPKVTAYASEWVNRAGLAPQLTFHVADSANPEGPPAARKYLGGAPQLIFIDSSHQYAHTIRELDLWYEQLEVGGMILLHDVSGFAASFDVTKNGGVKRALSEWSLDRSVQVLSINSSVKGGAPDDQPYVDVCGIAIIQRPPQFGAGSFPARA